MTVYEIDFVGTVVFTANDMNEALQKFMNEGDFNGCRPVKITEKELEDLKRGESDKMKVKVSYWLEKEVEIDDKYKALDCDDPKVSGSLYADCLRDAHIALGYEGDEERVSSVESVETGRTMAEW